MHVPVAIGASYDYMDAAFNTATRLEHSAYDYIYLAMAMETDALLITADGRFAAKAKEIYSHVQVPGG